MNDFLSALTKTKHRPVRPMRQRTRAHVMLAVYAALSTGDDGPAFHDLTADDLRRIDNILAALYRALGLCQPDNRALVEHQGCQDTTAATVYELLGLLPWDDGPLDFDILSDNEMARLRKMLKAIAQQVNADIEARNDGATPPYGIEITLPRP